MGKTLTVNSLTAYTAELLLLPLALQTAVGFGLSNNTTLYNYDDIFHGILMNRFGRQNMLEDWRTHRQTYKGYDNGISCQERMITPEDGNLTHCGRVTHICVFNTVKLGTSASSP